jgi:hypothetical protein
MARPQPSPWVPIQQATETAREAIDSAARSLAAGHPRDALRAAGWAWHEQRYLREAYEVATRAANEVGEEEIARALNAVLGQPLNAGMWLQAGWALIDQGASDLAVPLLEEAYRLDPENPEVRESLVIAYSDEGRHHDVVTLATSMTLAERPSLAFPLAWSALMTRRAETAERALAMLIKVAEKTPELRGIQAKASAALERYRAFPPADDVRHWHYIQYGGVTLDVASDLDLAGGRYNLMSFTQPHVASILLRLVRVCEVLEVPLGPWGFVSRDGEVIARTLGLLTNTPIVYGIPAEGWLVLGDPREVDPKRHQGFSPSDPALRTFALSFPWTHWGPRVTDVTGAWTELAVFPWNGGWRSAAGGRIVRDVPMDRRPPAEIAVDLAAVAGTVPPLGQELADFVLPRRSLLVLTQRNVLRGLPYVPDAPLPAASMNGMLE